MKIKINPDKLRERLEQQKEAASSKSPDSKDSLMVRAETAGDLSFRALPYIHNADPSCEPFLSRYYHFIEGVGYVYCPQKNNREDCHLCNFIWERAKETKGTASVKGWLKCLPTFTVLIPGIIRGREDEGVKFFKFSSREDKPSPKFLKVYGWFQNEDTEAWMDADKGDQGGFDIVLKYKEPDAEQSKFLSLRKGQPILSDVELARKSTDFGKPGEYEKFLDQIPNLDEVAPFDKKTTEDTAEIFTTWAEKIRSKSPKKSHAQLNNSEDLTVGGGDDSDADSQDELARKLADMGL